MNKQITNLLLVRDTFTKDATVGKLYVNGEVFCYTLEDAVRAEKIKIKGFTAITAEFYKVIITISKRFKMKLPLVLDVPNFDGIRFHGGNTSKDTEGCILVAFNKINDTTIQRSAIYKLVDVLEKLNKEIWLTITNQPKC